MWKTVDDYEKYEVSDLGMVRNARTKRVLKPRYDKDGYQNVYLYKDDYAKGNNQKIHRLVAKAFIESDGTKTQINHKNGVKSDNNVSNLEWCNRSENTRHAYKSGLLKANIRPAIDAHTKIYANDKLEIVRLRNLGTPVKEIAEKYGVSLNTIYEICKSKEVS